MWRKSAYESGDDLRSVVSQVFDSLEDVQLVIILHPLPDAADRCVQSTLLDPVAEITTDQATMVTNQRC